jgi:hypothetical protein
VNYLAYLKTKSSENYRMYFHLLMQILRRLIRDPDCLITKEFLKVLSEFLLGGLRDLDLIYEKDFMRDDRYEGIVYLQTLLLQKIKLRSESEYL